VYRVRYAKRIGADMAKFTDRDEIEVALRYIRRVRAMEPSRAALHDLDRQEAELKRRLRALDESESHRVGAVSLSSSTSLASPRHRAGF
jgi:hypothetical protein